jgi:aromatic ring-opening dioxygenase catalytic subunit (LigB family)
LLSAATGQDQAAEFNDWLIDVCTNPELDNGVRRQRLADWEAAPYARYCHPREEHLIPLHVCFGSAGGRKGEVVFNGEIMGLPMSSFYWD